MSPSPTSVTKMTLKVVTTIISRSTNKRSPTNAGRASASAAETPPRMPDHAIMNAPRQSIERRDRPLALLRRRLARVHTLDAELSHVAQGLFERRPALLLIGSKLEPGLERGDTRIGECCDIISTETMTGLSAGTSVSEIARTVESLLRIKQRRAADGKQCRRGNHGLEHVILRTGN